MSRIATRAGRLARAGFATPTAVAAVLESWNSVLGPDADRLDTLVAELALLTETVSPVTVIASEPSVLIRISRNLFRKMLEGYPAAAKRLRDSMADRLDSWTHELAAVKNKLDPPP